MSSSECHHVDSLSEQMIFVIFKLSNSNSKALKGKRRKVCCVPPVHAQRQPQEQKCRMQNTLQYCPSSVVKNPLCEINMKTGIHTTKTDNYQHK